VLSAAIPTVVLALVLGIAWGRGAFRPRSSPRLAEAGGGSAGAAGGAAAPRSAAFLGLGSTRAG
jgi:hypothetical protein